MPDDVVGAFHRFLNDPQVQELIHVRGLNVPGVNFHPEKRSLTPNNSAFNFEGYFVPKPWAVCNDRINDELKGSFPRSCVPALQYLVKHIRVLLYSGEFDLNTNFLGTLHVLEGHHWYEDRRWTTASRSLWKFGSDVAGEYFRLSDLSFLIVRNSGHLLPMDLPSHALDLIQRFVNDVTFADLPLPKEDEYYDQMVESNPSGNHVAFLSSRRLLWWIVAVIPVVLVLVGIYIALQK